MILISRRQILLAGAAFAALSMTPPALALDVAELNKPPALGEMALGADAGAKEIGRAHV